jgi:hypothetical protein
MERRVFGLVANFSYRSLEDVRYAVVSGIQIILPGVPLGALVSRWACGWFDPVVIGGEP